MVSLGYSKVFEGWSAHRRVLGGFRLVIAFLAVHLNHSIVRFALMFFFIALFLNHVIVGFGFVFLFIALYLNHSIVGSALMFFFIALYLNHVNVEFGFVLVFVANRAFGETWSSAIISWVCVDFAFFGPLDGDGLAAFSITGLAFGAVECKNKSQQQL